MKIEAKSTNKKTSTTEKVGKLTFIAEGDVDAVQLAELFRQWVAGGDEGSRIRQFRQEALMRYMKKHNLTLKVGEAA